LEWKVRLPSKLLERWFFRISVVLLLHGSLPFACFTDGAKFRLKDINLMLWGLILFMLPNNSLSCCVFQFMPEIELAI